MTSLKTLLFAAALPLALPAAVQAQEQVQLHIDLGQADPATSQGRAAIRLKLIHAADAFCDTADTRYGRRVVAAQRQCREAIIASAIASLESRNPNFALASR